MKRIRRFLAVLLCVCLVAAPMCPALSEDGALPVEAGDGEVITTEFDTGEPEVPSEPTAPAEVPADPDPAGDASSEPDATGSGDDMTPPEGGSADPASPGESEGEPGPETGDAGPDGNGGGNADPNGDADPNGNPPAGTDPAQDEVPDPNPEVDVDPNPDPNAIDYTQSAAASPAFCQGYAELLPDTAAYAEAGAGAGVLGTIGGGVVYALNRSATGAADRLEVAFDWNGVRYAWVDASRVRPMTPDEVTAFVLACAARENVCTMPDSPELPLDALECTPAAEGAGEPGAAEDDAAPEAGGDAAVVPPEAELIVPRSEFVLGVGDSCAIGASFDDGEKYLITYRPEDEGVVSVSEDGIITALAAGETAILLHSDIDNAEVRAIVEDAPTSVRLVAPRTVVGVGEQIQLKAEFPEGGTTSWEFSSSNDAVATVTAGIVMPVAPGTATITVTTANGLSDSVTLTVKPAPESIALNAEELTLGVGQTYQLRATVAPSAAAAVYAAFASSAEEVAQVDPATGLVTAVAPGSAEISVKTYNQTASCRVTVEYAPKEIAFQEEAITIGLKETVTVPLALTAPDGAPEDAACAASYTYTTSNKKIATVSGTGAIRGVKTGTATITVTTHNQLSASVKVTVQKAPTKVKLNAPTRVLGVGDSAQLGVSFSSKAYSRTLYFTSNNEGVLRVDGTGVITAVAKGTATVTVKTFNGKKASLSFTVMDGPEQLTLNVPDGGTIGVGQPCKLTVTLPSGTAGTYTFHVAEGDRGVLEVDEKTGALTAHAAGTAEVWATAYNQVESEHATITVLDAPEGISLSVASIVIGKGETAVMPGILIGNEEGQPAKYHASYTYASSKTKVATVNGNGAIYGKNTGRATITVTTHNGWKATLSVQVKKAPKKVYLSAARTKLGQGEKMALSATTSSGSVSRALTFTSSNENIVSVPDEKKGEVVAGQEKGTATITVRTYNGKTAKLNFTVVDAPTGAELNIPEDGTIGVEQPLSVSAALIPSTAAGSCTYQSDNPDVLDVDPNTGRLNAKKPGSARITVTPYVGASDTKEITVIPAPDSVQFAVTTIIIGQGESAPVPEVTLSTESGAPCKATLSYSTSNKKIATVNGNGVVYGKKTGRATITVTTHNKQKATLNVQVKKAPKKVYLSAARTKLGQGEKMALNATTSSGSVSRALTFTSSNENIVSVPDEKKGEVVAGQEKGTATITVRTYNGKTAKLNFTVVDAPTGVELNIPEDGTIGVEQPLSVSAALIPSTAAGSCTYQSDNPDVLDVDPNTGRLNAKKPGSARITVTPYVGASDTKEITVIPAPDSVQFAVATIIIGQGESVPVPEVTISTKSGVPCKATLSFGSSKTKVATVNGSGVVYGKKTGSATITVTTHNKQKATLSVQVKKTPKKVYLSAARTKLGVGETMVLGAWTNSGTVSRVLKFTSNNPAVLRVPDETKAEVYAEAPGTATITVRTFNGKTKSLNFTVVPAPTGVELNIPEDGKIGVGQPLSVSATLKDEGTAGAYTYRSSDEAKLAVDETTGKLTALQTGSAEITVETYNHKTDTKAIEVVPAPTAISLAETAITIGKGETTQVPEITIDPGSKASFSYGSSKTKVATVNGSGAIYGKKTGSATITVATHNGVKASLKVTVKNAPKKAYISAHHTTLGVGETLKVNGSTTSGSVSRRLTFTSSNPAVLEVTNDATGEVKAISAGTATITVATYNGKRASLGFKVVVRPDSVALSPKPLTLGAGEWYTVSSTTLPDGSGGGRTYSVDPEDQGVAAIDATTGKLHALAAGTATVRVTMYDDGVSPSATDSFELTVKAAPTGIQLNNGNITLSAGDGFQIPRPTPLGTDVHSETFSYKSSKTKYATVSGTGWVYAKKKGSSKITVSTYNGKSASFTVTVKTAPKSIGFSESKHRLFMDRSFQPVVNFANGVPGTYTLTSSDPGVARVAEDGKTIEAVSPGTITLTAKSFNNKTAKMEVWVPELPTSVWLVPGDLTLGEGDSAKVTVGVPANAGAEMTYESMNAGVAAVEVVDNETITVTAVRQGETTIHVHSQNGKDGYANVTVKKAPTALSLSPRRVERSIEEQSVQLSWGFGGEGEGGRVELSSSNTGVATVDASGLVTFHKVGTARITARSYNGHEAVCDLRVGEKPGKMFFEQESYKVALGDSVRIPASFDKGCESYAFTASGDCVSVSGDMVRGERIGTATLTATSRFGLTAACQVEVVPAPTGIEADIQDVIELIVGISSTKQLNAKPLPDGVGTVHYASGDPKVAVVDYDTGLVTPKGKGECDIIATTYNGYSTTYRVKVNFLLEGRRIGLDPGHQAKGDMSKERMSPNSKKTKYKCAYSSSGVAHVSEHVINLQMAIKLRDALEKLGAEVYLTRETANVNISNKQRAEMMNNLGVDFVLRIHCNAAGTSSAKGLSIIRRKTWAYSGNQTVNGVVVSGSTVKKQEKNLGNSLAYFFKKETGCSWRGLGTSDEYTMNNWSKVPCLLVELGFMTNPTEGKKLVQADYQQKMVRGLVKGICDYYKVPLPTEW